MSQIIRLSEVLVTFGVSLENIMMPFLFIMVPFLTFTIPIAYMFAVLLSFSRMSADGEFTGMLSVGYSMSRALVPVMMIGFVLYGVGVYSAMYLEPWGNRERVNFYKRKAETQLDNMIKVKLKPGVFMDDFLGYVLYAEEISKDRTRLDNVLMAPGGQDKSANFTLLAPSATISGSVEGGDLRMGFDYGMVYTASAQSNDVSVVKFKRAELDLLKIFQDKILGPDNSKTDYRSFDPAELKTYIDSLEAVEDESSKEEFRKAKFLFHQRMGMPFATVFFALYGMVLGIQDDRRGKGGGYLWTIATIIFGYILVMSFKFASENGFMDAIWGVWIPNLFLTLFGVFLVYQKNRLPPSESTVDPKLIPIVSKFLNLR